MMKRGFTMVELVLAIAIVLLVIYLILTSLPKLNDRQALSKETASVISILNQARSQTLASRSDTHYGVHFESAAVTIFPGSTYTAGSGSNSVFPLNSKVYISNITLLGGGSELIFDRQTGATSQPGSVTIALVASSTQSRVITISSTGIVDGAP